MPNETPINRPDENHGDIAGPVNPESQLGTPSKRKLGRKLHRDSWQDLQNLLACIRLKSEVTPGELAAQLGSSRSTLAYNLNRLLSKGYIERLGGGRSIRYRALPEPPKSGWRSL